ncbi:MAG TPA: hypothetical protein VGV15_22080, partial [Terriglobales bacterium]|nr:hypothetical protein [Terriglobales bacterium]
CKVARMAKEIGERAPRQQGVILDGLNYVLREIGGRSQFHEKAYAQENIAEKSISVSAQASCRAWVGKSAQYFKLKKGMRVNW